MDKRIFTDRPDLTAALRRLAWQFRCERRAFTIQKIEGAITRARSDMGLPPLKGGAATTLVQKRTDGAGQRDQSLPAHYRKETPGSYRPADDLDDWRFLGGHGHGEIRQVARDGLLVDVDGAGHADAGRARSAWQFVPRADHLPAVRCALFGAGDNAGPKLFDGVRGIYLARFQDKSYVGQTDELHVRWRQQRDRGAVHMVFVHPEDKDLPLDALFAAEGLAIAAFAELLQLANGKYGKDREPSRIFLRQASGFALVFQAAIVKLAAKNHLADVLRWRAERDVRGLQEAYLRLDDEPDWDAKSPLPRTVLPDADR